MSQSYIKGPVCGTNNCPSRLYRIIDGTKVCQYGHVIEGDVQIDDDEDTADFVVTKRLDFRLNEVDGTLIAKAPKTKRSKASQRLVGNSGKELYIKTLQKLLKIQMKELVVNFFDNDQAFLNQLELVVKVNWIKVLEGFLKEDSIENGQDKFQVQATTKLPNIVDTIFTIYFSVVELNYYPMYLSDLMELISTNKIPSVSTSHMLNQESLRQIPNEYVQSLVFPEFSDYWLQTSYTNFLTRVPKLTKHINYFYPFIFRILSEELLMPNAIELSLLVNNLITKLRFQFVYQHKIPELVIIGFIIFVVKIHFIYLNNRIDYEKWLNYLSEYDYNHHDFKQFMRRPRFESDYDLVNWSDKKIEEYLKFLNETMVRNEVKGDSNDPKVIMKDRLEKIFDMPPGEDVNVNNDIDEMLKYYSKSSKTKINDIYIIEDFLFKRFSYNWFVRKSTIYKNYNYVEMLVKDYIDKK